MGTNFIRANEQLGSATTTRYIMIATNVATQILLDSGNQALTLFNVGSATLVWGDSNIAVNSGNFLYVGVGQDFGKDGRQLQDGWSTYLRADSVQSLVAVTQYGG